MRPSTLAAGLLLAGCAGPAAAPPAPPPPPADPVLAAAADPDAPDHDAAREAWDETPWEEQCDRLRAALRSPDPKAALFAACALGPENLSLDEIHRQADLLMRHPDEVLALPGEHGCFRCDGGRSLGSPDVLRLLRAVVERRGFAADEHSFEDLHRLTIQDHIPGLAALLESATGDPYRSILWMLRLLADNTDRHREVVAQALLYARASWVAEKKGRPRPRLADFRVPEGARAGAATFRERYRGALEGGDPGDVDEEFPRSWMERWERQENGSPAPPGNREDSPAVVEVRSRVDHGKPIPPPGTAGDGVRGARWILRALASLEESEVLEVPEEGLRLDALRPKLERLRRERWRGGYWPATAGLAMAGDAAARAEFLAFLREDRISVYDPCFDPVTCTLNGDPEALAYWRSRVGSNCCLWYYAETALRRWYPTMPPGEERVGDSTGAEEKTRAWWEKWKDRLRWSRIADGWVPAAE